MEFYCGYWHNTVKPAVAATSIKRDPPVSSHFRAPRTILNANVPLLSVHLSKAANGRRNSPQNTEIFLQTANFYALMRPVSIKIASVNFFCTGHTLGAIKLPSSGVSQNKFFNGRYPLSRLLGPTFWKFVVQSNSNRRKSTKFKCLR